MAHKRKQIRESVVALLKADSALTALVPVAQIYESRVETIWKTKIPAVAVYTRNETSDDFNQYDRILDRTLELAVEIVVDGTPDAANIDDQLDAIAEAIENILLNSSNLVNSNIWQDIAYSGFEATFLGEGSKQVGAGRMEFEIKYLTEFN